jgi:RNase P/RNase MRP subunit POP5
MLSSAERNPGIVGCVRGTANTVRACISVLVMFQSPIAVVTVRYRDGRFTKFGSR